MNYFSLGSNGQGKLVPACKKASIAIIINDNVENNNNNSDNNDMKKRGITSIYD